MADFGVREVHLYWALRDILRRYGGSVPEHHVVQEITRYDESYTEKDVEGGLDKLLKNNDAVFENLSGVKYYSLR